MAGIAAPGTISNDCREPITSFNKFNKMKGNAHRDPRSLLLPYLMFVAIDGCASHFRESI